MVLSGAMFPFDKLNRKIGSVEKVPLIAELMPTRWTYEALMVSQFKDNRFSRTEYNRDGETYYSLQKKISVSDFNRVYRIPELKRSLAVLSSGMNNAGEYNGIKGPVNDEQKINNLSLIKNEFIKIRDIHNVPEFKYIRSLTPDGFSQSVADSAYAYLNEVDGIFNRQFNTAATIRDRFYNLNSSKLNRLQNEYFNYQMEQIVTKYYEQHKMLIYNNSIVQNVDPVYQDSFRKGPLSFRTHFFAPNKYFLGINTDTFRFNILAVLIGTFLLYLVLYFDLLAKTVRFVEKIKIRDR